MPSSLATHLLLLGLALELPLVAGATLAFAGEAPPGPAASEAPQAGDAAAPKVDLRRVADQDAARLDLEAIVNLPLAAADARDAGMGADDVADAIAAVVETGASPAVATDLLLAETAAVRSRGARSNFPAFVRAGMAEGKPTPEMLATIESREATYVAATAEQRTALDAKIQALHDKTVAARRADWSKLRGLAKGGERLERAIATELGELRKRVLASVARQSRLAEAEANDPGKKAALARALVQAGKAMQKAGRAIEAGTAAPTKED